MSTWIQGVPQIGAAFLGSWVETVEAMTIVLAGGRAIGTIPIEYLQIVIGTRRRPACGGLALAIVVLLGCTRIVAKPGSPWAAIALLVGGTIALLLDSVIRAATPSPALSGDYSCNAEPYAGNPTLWPMIESRLANDIVIVQLAPDRVDQVPADALAIRRRVGEIVFHSSLVAKMQAIHAMRALARRQTSVRSTDVRFHRIGPLRPELFEQGDGGERASAWLQLLHAEGLAAGGQFIARHATDIGHRETLDVAGVFVDARKPRIPIPAHDATQDGGGAALSRAA